MSIPYERSAALAEAGIVHGFFGRRGGVSTGAYASLNMSEKGGDNPTLVAKNRAQAAVAIQFSPDAIITANQVHSNRVLILTGPLAERDRPEVDALVTSHPDLLLGILTADCTPILLADADAGIIAAAHAGWRGAVDGIVTETVAAMLALGARPDRIVAAIGPTISHPNYEVGPKFAADLLALHPAAASRLATPPGGREHFDLPGFVADQLRAADVTRIDDLALCTYAAPDRYFSHRYATHQGTTTGRQIALIGLR